MRQSIIYLLMCSLSMATLITRAQSTASQLIVTGKVTSSNVQVVSAPRTDRWNIQIQWMVDEGSIVEPGDTIALSPPLIIEKSHIDFAFDTLRDILKSLD